METDWHLVPRWNYHRASSTGCVPITEKKLYQKWSISVLLVQLYSGIVYFGNVLTTERESFSFNALVELLSGIVCWKCIFATKRVAAGVIHLLYCRATTLKHSVLKTYTVLESAIFLKPQ